MAWILLVLAIGSEVAGTVGLRSTADKPTWWLILLIVVAYSISFSLLAIVLRRFDVGVVYALWSGVGTAAIAGLGVLVFNERLDWRAVLGLTVIVIGVVILVSSGSVRHG